MTNSGQLINGLWMGIVLIVIGLTPGLLSRCTEAMSGFAAMLTYRFPGPTAPRQMKQLRWLAVAGVAIIAFSFLLYFAR